MTTLVAAGLVLMALSLAPGDGIVVRGAMTTSHDGARFDAGQMFDAEAGGLRLADQASSEPGAVRFEATGEVGTACVRAGIASPCLVPRLADLGHARLLSAEELRATLRGSFAWEVLPKVVPPPPPSPWPARAVVLSCMLAVGGVTVWAGRRRRATPFGRVRAAARRARRVTGADPTLAALRDEIARLEAEAAEVDRARSACSATLARTPVASHREEQEEVRRLERDVAAARARLEDIAAALRTIPLRVREHRDLALKLPRESAMTGVRDELDLRERALEEVER